MTSTTTPDTRQPDHAGGSGGGTSVRRGLVLIAASLGFAVIQLDVSVVNVAIKPIGAALGGGVTGPQWVIDAYTLALAALILTGGAVADRLGDKRMFVAGFALFTAASVACGLAPSRPVLVASRAIQGAGAAILGACSLVPVNHAYPQSGERARAVGLWAAGASVALAAGPLIGGALIATASWRAIFFINVPVGLAGIGLTARCATETPRTRDRGLDLAGQLTAIVALAGFAGATIEAGSGAVSTPLIVAGFMLAMPAGAGFAALEAQGSRPMLPLTLFRMACRRWPPGPRLALTVSTGLALLLVVGAASPSGVLTRFPGTRLSREDTVSVVPSPRHTHDQYGAPAIHPDATDKDDH